MKAQAQRREQALTALTNPCAVPYCRENKDSLMLAPSTLEQLAELVGLHRRLADERRRTEARFEPLRDKYKLLERYEVGAKEEEAALLEGLEPAWTQFQVRGASASCDTVCVMHFVAYALGSCAVSCCVGDAVVRGAVPWVGCVLSTR